jgi:hypothetical protein
MQVPGGTRLLGNAHTIAAPVKHPSAVREKVNPHQTKTYQSIYLNHSFSLRGRAHMQTVHGDRPPNQPASKFHQTPTQTKLKITSLMKLVNRASCLFTHVKYETKDREMAIVCAFPNKRQL